MDKTGWPPPPLMQDDNPQLSRWFASRPDALYVLKTNQRRKQMKYRVQVVMSYWQTIEVEAVSKDFAEVMALEMFDITKARMGDGEVYDTELIEGESK
jgi:hypothetical protein